MRTAATATAPLGGAPPVARPRGSAGQALIPALALALVILLGASGVTVVGAGYVAAARAQRVADLSALSAVRLGASGAWDEALPDGRVLGTRLAPVLAGARGRLESVRFPAGDATDVEVVVAVPGPLGTWARARARAALRVDASALTPDGWAHGGGYVGPLVHRDGRPTCPPVAAAFDLMDAAAHRDGLDLIVVSGFRSDAEQAVLFARHPDPRWVAPPGRSRHRDATELDLGPPAAYRWLAARASAFGFVQRYSWEAWHFGYLAGCGAPPRRAAPQAPRRRPGVAADDADRGDAARPPGATASPAAVAALPDWVPVEYRDLIVRAARAQGVPPVLLAALLRAESGFRRDAVSPAGAQGIAQFMPGTAAGMGLRDPFDPAQAIPAAARLLGGHLRRSGSVPLALAAYNAGAGAVARYGGMPPYPETQAYVARITALAGGTASPGGTDGTPWGIRATLVPVSADVDARSPLAERPGRSPGGPAEDGRLVDRDALEARVR